MSNYIQQINEALQKRQKVVEDQRAIYTNAKNECRSTLNDEEQTRYDKFDQDFLALDKTVRNLEELQKREERLAMDQHNGSHPNVTTTADDELEKRAQEAKDYRKLFLRYVRFGKENLSSEEVRTIRKYYGDVDKRNQTTQTGSSGGYLIPTTLASEIEKSMLYYGGMLEATRIMNTDDGGTINFTTRNDTSNTGRWLAENTAVTKTDIVYGQSPVEAWKASSDEVRVPYELLEDSAFDFNTEVGEVLAERLGRIINTGLTTGDGSGKPHGVTVDAALGKTTASATAFTRAEILALIHSVDPSYRKGKKVGLMFHDNILLSLKQLSIGSSDDRPLWVSSMRDDAPDKIEGYQYWINNDMASAVTTGQKIMLFGDFSKYRTRMVNGLRMRRLVERYADTDQVAFIGFRRVDGRLLNTAAVKHMITA